MREAKESSYDGINKQKGPEQNQENKLEYQQKNKSKDEKEEESLCLWLRKRKLREKIEDKRNKNNKVGASRNKK